MPEKSIIKTLFIIIITVLVAQPGKIYAGSKWKYYYAKAELQYIGEKYRFAMENYQRALKLNPSLFQAANRMASIQLKQEQKDRALRYFTASLKINDLQPDIHNRAGVLHEFFGHFEQSFRHYSRAVELDPAHVAAHFNLVRHYIRKGDKASADRHFAICFKAGSREGNILFEQAEREEKRGEINRAVELYNKTINKNPAQIEAYFRLVEIFREREENDKAILYLERVKQVRPDNEKAHLYLGHLYFIKPSIKRKNYYLTLSVRNLRKAIELNPKNRDTYILLSDVYRYMGNIEKAKEIQKMAQEIK